MKIPSILLVDDDPDIRTIIRIALTKAGMEVVEAATGLLALDQLLHDEIDLVILDIGMPAMDGFECCKAIRVKSNVPVLFLTAQDDEIDRVLAFELGADDYVTKPFSPRELVLRVKAILGRGKPYVQNLLEYGDLKIDPDRHSCTLDGHDLELTVTEFAVLRLLMARLGSVVDRNALIVALYGENNTLSGRTVDSHVRNIRSKAAALGYADIVATVRGVGLRLGSCVPQSDVP